MIDKLVLVDHTEYREYPVAEMKERAESFYHDMRRRRTIRDFSDRDVPQEIIENCLRTAGSAVSGANMQPWQFVVIKNPDIKQKIRKEAPDANFNNPKEFPFINVIRSAMDAQI